FSSSSIRLIFSAAWSRQEVEPNPTVAVLGYASQCRIALAAEPHRDAFVADRLRVAQHIREIDELALMRAAPLGPELAHDLDILARALTTTLERDAQSCELLRPPSDTNAEDEPAATQTVDCCHGLGQHEGVVLGYETDTRRQPDPGCAGGRIGQCREGVCDRSVGWRRKVTTRVPIP